MIRIKIGGTESKHSGENLTVPLNTYMLISEITITDWKASKKVCNSNTPDEQLGASTLSSCKSQGLRKRSGEKTYTIGGKKTRSPVRRSKVVSMLVHYPYTVLRTRLMPVKAIKSLIYCSRPLVPFRCPV